MQLDSYIKTPHQEQILQEYREIIIRYRDAFIQVERHPVEGYSMIDIINRAIDLLKSGTAITFLPTPEDNERAKQAGRSLNKVREYIAFMQKEDIPATICFRFSRRILEGTFASHMINDPSR